MPSKSSPSVAVRFNLALQKFKTLHGQYEKGLLPPKIEELRGTIRDTLRAIQVKIGCMNQAQVAFQLEDPEKAKCVRKHVNQLASLVDRFEKEIRESIPGTREEIALVIEGPIIDERLVFTLETKGRLSATDLDQLVSEVEGGPAIMEDEISDLSTTRVMDTIDRLKKLNRKK